MPPLPCIIPFVLVVVAAMLVFGDQLTTVNALGLGIVICGVCLFNYHKYTRNKVRGGRLDLEWGLAWTAVQRMALFSYLQAVLGIVPAGARSPPCSSSMQPHANGTAPQALLPFS